MSEYPEHDKMQAVVGDSNIITEFLDWLPSQDLRLAKWVTYEGDLGEVEKLVPVFSDSFNGLMAMYFNIDLTKIENEKREMLQACRALSEKDSANIPSELVGNRSRKIPGAAETGRSCS